MNLAGNMCNDDFDDDEGSCVGVASTSDVWFGLLMNPQPCAITTASTSVSAITTPLESVHKPTTTCGFQDNMGHRVCPSAL